MDAIINRMDNLGKNLKIFRILNGMWQVSGGHGKIQPQKAIESIRRKKNGYGIVGYGSISLVGLFR